MVNQSGSWYVTFCNVLDPSTDSRASQAPAGFDSAPPPAYQMAIQGSRYGFRPSDPEKQHGPDGNTFPASLDRGTAPSSHVSVAPSSRKVPIIPISRDAPMFRGGSITRGISPAPSFRGGSITPSSRGGSTALNSRGGSTAPNSRGGPLLRTLAGVHCSELSRGIHLTKFSERFYSDVSQHVRCHGPWLTEGVITSYRFTF